MRATARLLAILAALSARAAVAAAAGDPGDVQTWSVDVATEAALVEDHRAPLVEVRLVFPVGTWSDWPRSPEDLAAAWELQLHDAPGRLRARADRLAADVTLRGDARSFTLAAGCRREDLDSLLVLLRDLLANRDFDPREVSRHNRGSDLDWEAGKKNPDFMLDLAVRRRLWQKDDPRARPLARPPSWRNEAARLAALRDTLVRLPRRMIGIAGDLVRAEAERLAAGLLPAALPAPPALRSGLKPARGGTGQPSREELRLPRLTQAYFRVVRHGLSALDPDYPALLVANHVLGGHFYSRLTTALRHEGGYTYHVGSSFAIETDTTAYVLRTYTSTARADTVERRLREVLAALQERGVTEEERAAAVGYLQGRRAFQRQAPVQILERYLWERRRGLPPGHRDRAVERAAALSLEQVNAFVRRFYDPAAFAMIVARAR